MFEILVKCWSELTVLIRTLLAGVGFILRQYFVLNLKQKEITYSNVRATKVRELKAFYRSYIELEKNLKALLHAVAQNNNEQENELRKILPEKWLEFRYNVQFLQIFLTAKERKQFDELSEQLNEAQLQIDFYCIDKAFETISKETIKTLIKLRDEIFPKAIPAIMKELEDNLRDVFKIKHKSALPSSNWP